MPATLHSFLNDYTTRGPWTVLTTLNVYLTGVLQYIFLVFVLYNVVCSEYGQYCSSTTLLVHCLMLARWFDGCFLLLFDSTLQSSGPAIVPGPLGACSPICFFPGVLVCFNFASLRYYIRSWTCCCSLHAKDFASVIVTVLLSFPIH